MKNILKKNIVLKELVNELKITYESDEMSIHFYREIISISDNLIEFKFLNVYGNNLLVTYIDKYIVTICGMIEKVERVRLHEKKL